MRGVAGVAGVLVKWAQVFDTAIRFTADASASWPVVTTLPHTPLAYPDGWRLRRAARHGPLRGGAVEPGAHDPTNPVGGKLEAFADSLGLTVDGCGCASFCHLDRAPAEGRAYVTVGQPELFTDTAV